MLTNLWVALAFLTRVPLPRFATVAPERIGAATPWFPVVGLLIGCGLVGVDLALRSVFPSLVASVLAVLFLLLVTGALHLDGLKDTADALFVHATPERRLEIMRDPRAGTFGVAAVVAILLLKVAAIEALPPPIRAGTLALAPVVGRWTIALAALAFPYARQTGLGAPLRASASLRTFALASVLPIAMLGIAHPLPILLTLVGGLSALALGRWLAGHLGGLTGDCYGAICELTETLVLVLATPVAVLLR